MKPVVVFVDDEPHNLVVFEAAMPDDWDIKVFNSPLEALTKIVSLDPAVVISDQRMPGKSGNDFLAVVKELKPDALRLITTGYSDEQQVIEAIRTASVYDYIIKPWEPDDLISRIKRAIDLFTEKRKATLLQKELELERVKLTAQNNELEKVSKSLDESLKQQKELKAELECWVPPFIKEAITNGLKFPFQTSLVALVMDIVGSSKLHGVYTNGKSIRARVLQQFSEHSLRYGGWRESHEGDSAYSHFGLIKDGPKAEEAALGVANEFRTSLRSLSETYNVNIECGLALHYIDSAEVSLHSVAAVMNNIPVIHKSFDTTSVDIDLVHRIEKVAHLLPGTNIILTSTFLSRLNKKPKNLLDIGEFYFSKENRVAHLFLIPSDKITQKDLENFKKKQTELYSPINVKEKKVA